MITAKYAGNSDFVASSSHAVSQAVKPDATTTALTSSLNPSVYGQSVRFTATVTSASPVKPAGTVTFLANGKSIGTGSLVSGVATFTTTTLAAGTNAISAKYAGNSNFTASSSSAVSEVTKAAATTSVSPSLHPSIPGQQVTFAATVASRSSATPAACSIVNPSRNTDWDSCRL